VTVIEITIVDQNELIGITDDQNSTEEEAIAAKELKVISGLKEA